MNLSAPLIICGFLSVRSTIRVSTWHKSCHTLGYLWTPFSSQYCTGSNAMTLATLFIACGLWSVLALSENWNLSLSDPYLLSTVVVELMGGNAACLVSPGGCGVPFMRANKYRSTRSFCSQVKSPTSTLPVTPYLQRTWVGEMLINQKHCRHDGENGDAQKSLVSARVQVQFWVKSSLPIKSRGYICIHVMLLVWSYDMLNKWKTTAALLLDQKQMLITNQSMLYIWWATALLHANYRTNFKIHRYSVKHLQNNTITGFLEIDNKLTWHSKHMI